MADESSTTLNTTILAPATIAPIAGQNFPAGAVARIDASTGKAVLAEGNNATDANAIGLVQHGVTADGTARAFVQYVGPLTLTTDQWDAIAGTEGGLVPNTQYYVSSTVAGKLIGTAPSAGGTYKQRVGVALSSTTLLVLIGAPVAN